MDASELTLNELVAERDSCQKSIDSRSADIIEELANRLRYIERDKVRISGLDAAIADLQKAIHDRRPKEIVVNFPEKPK